MEKAVKEFGAPDVLINSAGVAYCNDFENTSFEKFDEEGRRWEIALNIDGVVNCCQAVAEDMLGRKHGSVINISSNSSLLGEAAANIVHYGGVKGFVNSFRSPAVLPTTSSRASRSASRPPRWEARPTCRRSTCRHSANTSRWRAGSPRSSSRCPTSRGPAA